MIEQQERDLALAAVRERMQRRPAGFDGSCGDCGEDVHPGRVGLGYYDCVECATLRERNARLRA